MKIINPSFELVTPLSRSEGIEKLRFIEKMARISHRSEDCQTPDSWIKFLNVVVLQHGDWSVTEHQSATVIIRTDRGVTHELVRHRLFSFTQESTRFVRYGKKHDLEFIRPSEMKEGQGEFLWRTALGESEKTYFDLLADGNRPQEARAVLPNCLAATIAVTGNLRTWRYFFLARTSRETHPDFRRITEPLLQKFKELIPLLYDDIEPGARQIDNFGKAH